MSRVKAKNPIFVKVSVTILVVVLSVALVALGVWTIIKSMNSLAYDIGEKDKITGYKDHIIKNYYDYLDLVKLYDIEENLTIDNFENNYYIVSFQEHDPCGESKFMDVEDVVIGDKITVSFKINNSCGWCKKHIVLHLIKIDKIKENLEIEYKYDYAKELECGTI
ncbi:MAG: hypothetical protein IJO63_03295 [Bacilli bacterium]|nr:hypothetical protein [Bacilli bacterium]